MADARIKSTEMTLDQSGTPASPAAGSNKLYPKSDGNWYTLDSSGNERALLKEPTTVSEFVLENTSGSPGGFGSTGTKTRYYGNVISSSGSAISRTASSTNGDSFTVNEDGIYTMSASDLLTSPSAGNKRLGFTRNSSSAATSIASLTNTQVLAFTLMNDTGNTTGLFVSWTGFLSATDIIRVQFDDTGGFLNNDSQTRFRITQLSKT